MHLFQTSITSPILIIATLLYFISAAITTYDIRTIQSKKNGSLSADTPMLPEWFGFFGWLMWGLWLFIFFLNWQYAVVLIIIKFILKVLPILEVVGGSIVSWIIGDELSTLEVDEDTEYSDFSNRSKIDSIPDYDAMQPRSRAELIDYLKVMIANIELTEAEKIAYSYDAIEASDVSDEEKVDLMELHLSLFKESLKKSPKQDEHQNEILYDKAIKVIQESGIANTAILQRRLHLDYGKAARLIELLEDTNIIGPKDGNKPRQINIPTKPKRRNIIG